MCKFEFMSVFGCACVGAPACLYVLDLIKEKS